MKLTVKMKRVTAWLAEQWQLRREKRQMDRHAAMVRASRRTVQVREFCGETYLCVNNVPLVPVEAMEWDLPTVLEVARSAWVKWRREEDER